MDCPKQGNAAFYRPRKPWESPLYRLVEGYYERFERVYADRFQHKYGFWRPVIRKAVEEYLKCGDLREGFARVRCPESASLVPFCFPKRPKATAAPSRCSPVSPGPMLLDTAAVSGEVEVGERVAEAQSVRG